MKDYVKLHSDFKDRGLFFKFILDATFEAFFTKSPDGIVTLWSKGAEQIYGYKDEEIVGKSVEIIIPEDRKKEVKDILEKNAKGEKVENLQTQRKSKDGKIIEVLVSSVPLYSENEIIGSVVFHRDVSLQKETEKKYQELFDQASDAILIADVSGHLTEVNAAAIEMLGYTKDEILGKNIIDLIPPEDAEKIDNGRLILEKEGKIQVFSSLKAKNGKYIPVDVSINQLHDKRRQVIARDISKQREAERKYRDLFEQGSDAIFIADLNGRYSDINTAAINMLGYAKEELVGKTILDLIPPEQAKQLQESKQKLLQPGEVDIAEWNLRKKDGQYLPVEVSAKILPDGRWQAFVRDLSKQKEAENKFSFIFESEPDALLLVKENGDIQLANEQSEKLFGYSKNELIGQKIEILLPEQFRAEHPAKRNEFVEDFKQRRMRGRVQLSARKKDGKIFPVDILLSPVKMDTEKIVLTSVRDLTEVKELSSYARNLLEASLDPFIVTDLDGRITDSNQSAIEFFGGKKRDLLSTNISIYFTDPDGFKQNIEKVAKQNTIKNLPFRSRDRTGNLVDFLVSASVYNDYYGKKEGIFYSLKDVSELIKIANKLIAEERRSLIKQKEEIKENID